MEKNRKLRFFPIIIICLAFVMLSIALVGQRFYAGPASNGQGIPILPQEQFASVDESPGEKECLVLVNSTEENSVLAWEDIRLLFGQLDVEADYVDVSSQDIPSLDGYAKVVTALVEYGILGEHAYDLMDWVSEGGGLMVYFPPQGDLFFRALGAQMGIRESGWEMYEVTGLRFASDLLLGGQGKDFSIEASFESSLMVSLLPDCVVHIVSANERELPILWERQYEDGRIVFMNFGIMGKAYRGIYAAAYSLLGGAFAWPVINGSAFYLDDFPAPIPDGSSAYIDRDYGINISDFYTNIWWPDLLELGETYGIRYSGMLIEYYSNDLEAPFEENADTQRFQYFGSSLLQNGGEIGLHGYNHIPLAPEGAGAGEMDGGDWKTREDMRASLEELVRFTKELFPEVTPQVYAPPANIFSEEGRQMLAEEFPGIRAVAGVYFEGDREYTQEFGVGDDGIVETPRIVSGLMMNSFMELSALSELNLHYVSSHFQHPDEVLNAGSGAEAGWEAMKGSFMEYLDWLYTSAPDIRNLTASDMAGAVQRYHYLDVEQEITEDAIILELDNFQDEAYLFLRINERTPEDLDSCISGGTIQDMGGGLYLVAASGSRIVIQRGET